MKIPPFALESGSEDVDAIMQQFDTISFDVIQFPTHVLACLQNTGSQELAYREAIVCDHLVKSHDQVVVVHEEIKQMKPAQEAELMSQEKKLDNKACLKKSIAIACQEIPNITEEMFVEAKIL